MTTLQPLSKNVQIVNSDGTPTEYFMRLLQERGLLQGNDHDRIGTLEKRKINTTAPLAGGGDLTADRTLTLADSGVTPGTYGDATHVGQFHVDGHGIVTAASSVPITFGSTLEVDDSVGVVQTNVVKLKFVGATVTAPVAGEADVTIPAGVSPSRLINTSGGLQGGGDLSADRTLSLTDTGVTAGTYALATVTVDGKGRITGISANSFPAQQIWAPASNGALPTPSIIFNGIGEVVMVRIV